MNAVIIKKSAMGGLRKIINPPWDIVRDWRTDLSKSGVKINAKTNGTGSYSNFLMRYPITPKMIMMITSW